MCPLVDLDQHPLKIAALLRQLILYANRCIRIYTPRNNFFTLELLETLRQHPIVKPWDGRQKRTIPSRTRHQGLNNRTSPSFAK